MGRALNQNLNLYVLQLDFLSICDRLNNELSLGREFLSKYKDSKYQDIDIMNEHKKSINDFIFSNHWIDSPQQEKRKLIKCIKQMDSVLNEDQELVILSASTANKLVQIIDNDFDDFTNLCKTVIAYYDEGIKKWKEFLGEVKDRKLYPLVFTIIELDDNINKMEVILSETEEKVNSNVEQYSKANQMSI